MTRTGALEGQLGMDRALERVEDTEWLHRVRMFLDRIGSDFTSDTIREWCGDPPGSGNALGAVLAAEVRAGRIEVVGRRKSTRPDRHRARLNVYRGRSA